MTTVSYPPLDITSLWAMVNDELIGLLDLIPDDQLNYSPKPELWNFKGLFIHMVFGRHGMMNGIIQDGQGMPEVIKLGQTKEGLREQLRASWLRMEPFLRSQEQLDHEYEAVILNETGRLNGHGLAFGQLEHDLHHRADICHYLRELGIAHEEPDTPARVLREQMAT
jgi:uncharacterized damage-inducible protein DinB